MVSEASQQSVAKESGSHYEDAVKDRTMPQDVHFGYRIGDRLEIYADRLNIQRAASP